MGDHTAYRLKVQHFAVAENTGHLRLFYPNSNERYKMKHSFEPIPNTFEPD